MWECEPQAEQELRERDWASVLEAVERDLTQLSNDFKFRQLAAAVEARFEQVQLDDVYARGWDARGPWTALAERVRQDLEDTNSVRERAEALQERVKEQALQALLLKREKDDLIVVSQALEQRLGDAQSKAEKVPALEMERKRLLEKEAYYNQQLDHAKRELEALREREKELQAKVTELETNPALAREMARQSVKKQQTSTTNASARQQRTSQYFQKLALLGKRDSILNLGRQASTASSNELQKQLQAAEDAFTGVVTELQRDRLLLKGQNALERLQRLERAPGPMNEFIRLQRERKETAGRLSKEEQGRLESALDNVMYLKRKMKQEMALAKVVDLAKARQEDAPAKREFVPEGAEKLNYELLKAKD